MLNFTVGPVTSDEVILSLGNEQIPYFRTPEFSELMLENEELMLKFTKAPTLPRVVFMTESGTLSMEAAVMNLFTSSDRVLVVDGGNFGHRFVQMLKIHDIPCTAIKPKTFGCSIAEDDLASYDDQGYTDFIVNLDETSIGVFYNIELIRDFCKKNNLFY